MKFNSRFSLNKSFQKKFQLNEFYYFEKFPLMKMKENNDIIFVKQII